jgi:dUTP pyrophosphatase
MGLGYQLPEVSMIRIRSIVSNQELMPKYQTAGSSGMDLRARVSALILPGTWKVIPCGVSVSLPVGMEAQVRSRSGLASKCGVVVLNGLGTIDSDYRGEICVQLINHGKVPFQAFKGDRVAQLVFAAVMRAELVLVESLDSTDRGEGGFGSTGMK